MSNTKKCSLCEKEYTAILPNCPNCLCPANNKVVSNTDYLKEAFPQSNEDLTIEIPGDYYDTIKQLDEAIKAKKVAEEIAETCKNQIKGLMGEAERAYWQGELKYTWKTGKKSRVFKTIGGSDE